MKPAMSMTPRALREPSVGVQLGCVGLPERDRGTVEDGAEPGLAPTQGFLRRAPLGDVTEDTPDTDHAAGLHDAADAGQQRAQPSLGCPYGCTRRSGPARRNGSPAAGTRGSTGRPRGSQTSGDEPMSSSAAAESEHGRPPCRCIPRERSCGRTTRSALPPRGTAAWAPAPRSGRCRRRCWKRRRGTCPRSRPASRRTCAAAPAIRLKDSASWPTSSVPRTLIVLSRSPCCEAPRHAGQVLQGSGDAPRKEEGNEHRKQKKEGHEYRRGPHVVVDLLGEIRLGDHLGEIPVQALRVTKAVSQHDVPSRRPRRG